MSESSQTSFIDKYMLTSSGFKWFSCSVCCFVIMAVCLGLVVGLSYIPTNNNLVKDNCVITGKSRSEEYYRSGYCYDPFDGSRQTIWISANYEIITVSYRPPYALNDSDYERIFKSCYWYSSDQTDAYNKIVLWQSTVPCWYNKEDKTMISIPKDYQLTGPIVGVVIMSFAVLVSIIVVIAMWFCCYEDDIDRRATREWLTENYPQSFGKKVQADGTVESV